MPVSAPLLTPPPAPPHPAAQMARMMEVLREEDAVLHAHLTEELGIVPCLFAFKWFGTLFTQTFLLPDLMRLWDSLVSVADTHRVEFFVCLAVAFILLANSQVREPGGGRRDRERSGRSAPEGVECCPGVAISTLPHVNSPLK